MDISIVDKKKKILLVFVFIALGLLAIGGIVAAFLLNYNSLSPNKPIIIDDGEGIYITTSLNENYKGYRFKFEEEGNTIYIESPSNQLSIEKMLQNNIKIGKNYDVSVCYVGETEGSTSLYSEAISWLCCDYLDRPVISLDNQKNEVSWQAVDGATSYIVYLIENGVVSSQIVQTAKFNYTELKGGEKQIYVVARSSSACYKDSLNSNIINFTHTYNLKNIKKVEINSDKSILKVTSEDRLDFLKLHLGKKEYIVNLEGLALSIDDEKCEYIYSIDISSVYTEGEIGVAPYPTDAYTNFVGSTYYI